MCRPSKASLKRRKEHKPAVARSWLKDGAGFEQQALDILRSAEQQWCSNSSQISNYGLAQHAQHATNLINDDA